MINIQKEYNKAVKAKNSCKQQFLLKMQKTFLLSKDKPPSLLDAESQLLVFISQNAESINSQELDSLILSISRKDEALCSCGELLKAS